MKGITVVIGGDTTGLSKALSGINKEIKNTQAQLKDVERLLKLDPTNTKLLEQRQRLLAEAVNETKTKLDTLKTAEKQVQEQFKAGKVSQQQYDALQREIAETEASLQKLEGQIEDTGKKSKDFAKSLSDGAQKAIPVIKNVGVAIAGVATAAVGLVESTKELRSDISKLEANAKSAGIGVEETTNALKDLQFVSGETDSSVEALSNLLAADFDEENLADIVEQLSGAVIKFPDTIKIESLADGLQETLATGKATGQFAELLDRVGIGAENFSAGLEDATAAGREQQYVIESLAKAGLGDIAKQYEEANESQKKYSDAQLDLNLKMAEIAERIEPLVAEAIENLTGLLEKHSGTIERVISIVSYFLEILFAVVSVISEIPAPILLAIASIIMMIKAFTSAQKAVEQVTGGWSSFTTALSASKGKLLMIITIVLALASAIALLVYLLVALKEGADRAEDSLKRFKDVRIDQSNIRPPNIGMPMMANGGTVTRGSAIVGEAGPELLTVSGGAATVTPLSSSGSFAPASAGNIYIDTISIPARDVREFNDIVRIVESTPQIRRARGI